VNGTILTIEDSARKNEQDLHLYNLVGGMARDLHGRSRSNLGVGNTNLNI